MGGRPADGRLRPDLDLRRGDADPGHRQGQGPEPDVGILVRADRRTSSPTTSSPTTCPRRSPTGRCGCGGWRCTRSSASSAATSPARAGRNTSEGGAVCGIELPAGLVESDKLPEPIFTPATKAEIGDHDENVDFERAAEIVGDRALLEELRRVSIEVYQRGAEHAAERGIILADTKFEFGRHAGAEVVLGDEVLTPDSSRFWPADGYEPGKTPPSFDKQFVRDWASEQGWDKTPPAPELPPDVIEQTRGKYVEAYERITETSF